MRKHLGPTTSSLHTPEIEAQEVRSEYLNEFGRPPLDLMSLELNRKAVKQFDLYKSFDGGFLFDLDPETLPDGYVLVKCYECESPIILTTVIDEGNLVPDTLDQDALVIAGDGVLCSKCARVAA